MNYDHWKTTDPSREAACALWDRAMEWADDCGLLDPEDGEEMSKSEILDAYLSEVEARYFDEINLKIDKAREERDI